MVEADEAGTVARLNSLQTEPFRPMIAEDSGRVVKLMGDGMLAEFRFSELSVLLRAKIHFGNGAKCKEASPSSGKSRFLEVLTS